jgi:hypothetical protein
LKAKKHTNSLLQQTLKTYTMQHLENTPSDNLEPKEERNETISELADRHLKDENHTTTDEEIRNAKLEIDETTPDVNGLEKLAEVDNTTIIPPLPGEEDKDKKDKKDDNPGTPHVPNPYDVLG